jgi:DNA polymerase
MAYFIPNAKISSIHGQAMQVRGRLIVAMYHPAAALHQGSLRPVIETDFSRIPDLIAKAGNLPEYQESHQKNREEPKQLSMF